MRRLFSSEALILFGGILFGLNFGYLMLQQGVDSPGYPLIVLVWSLSLMQLGQRWMRWVVQGWAEGRWRIVAGGLLGALPALLLWRTNPTILWSLLPFGLLGAMVGAVLPRVWRPGLIGALVGLVVMGIAGWAFGSGEASAGRPWVESPVIGASLVGALVGGFLAIQWALRKADASSNEKSPPLAIGTAVGAILIAVVGASLLLGGIRILLPLLPEPLGTLLFPFCLLGGMLLLSALVPGIHGERTQIMLRSSFAYLTRRESAHVQPKAPAESPPPTSPPTPPPEP